MLKEEGGGWVIEGEEHLSIGTLANFDAATPRSSGYQRMGRSRLCTNMFKSRADLDMIVLLIMFLWSFCKVFRKEDTIIRSEVDSISHGLEMALTLKIQASSAWRIPRYTPSTTARFRSIFQNIRYFFFNLSSKMYYQTSSTYINGIYHSILLRHNSCNIPV